MIKPRKIEEMLAIFRIDVENFSIQALCAIWIGVGSGALRSWQRMLSNQGRNCIGIPIFIFN